MVIIGYYNIIITYSITSFYDIISIYLTVHSQFTALQRITTDILLLAQKYARFIAHVVASHSYFQSNQVLFYSPTHVPCIKIYITSTYIQMTNGRPHDI